MRRRARFRRACLAAAVLTVAGGRTRVSQASEGMPDPRSTAIPLRTTRSVSFANDRHLAWVSPAVCDAEGNLFLIPVPRPEPRDLVRPVPPRHTKKPSDILDHDDPRPMRARERRAQAHRQASVWSPNVLREVPLGRARVPFRRLTDRGEEACDAGWVPEDGDEPHAPLADGAGERVHAERARRAAPPRCGTGSCASCFRPVRVRALRPMASRSQPHPVPRLLSALEHELRLRASVAQHAAEPIGDVGRVLELQERLQLSKDQ